MTDPNAMTADEIEALVERRRATVNEQWPLKDERWLISDESDALALRLAAVLRENERLRSALMRQKRKWEAVEKLGEEAALRWEAGYVNPHDSKSWIGKVRSYAYLETAFIDKVLEERQ